MLVSLYGVRAQLQDAVADDAAATPADAAVDVTVSHTVNASMNTPRLFTAPFRC